MPEYIISNHIEDYVLNGFKKNTNYNYLSLYGKNDEFADKLENYTDLSSSYNTTDLFLNDNNIDTFNLDKIKINCESIIKLLPYNNFYPQQKAQNIVNTFQKSYFNYTSSNILFENNTTSNIGNNNEYPSGSTLNHQMQTILQQFFAPGVLFNSIKSGMGVSYPAMITSSVPFSSSTPPLFYSQVNVNSSLYIVDKEYTKYFNINDLLDIDNSLNTVDNPYLTDIENYSLYYLAPNAYDKYHLRTEPRYPQYRLKMNNKSELNDNLISSKDSRYKLAIHNYLSEIVNTFIENSSLTTFNSLPEQEFGVFSSSIEYSMLIHINKQDKNLKMFVKLKDEDRFVKNVVNKSLINTDIAGLKDYKNKKELARQVNDISGEINNMKSEMSEIKSLLQQLVKQNLEK
jgi:hypothetical protein